MNQQIKKRLWIVHFFFAAIFGVALIYSLCMGADEEEKLDVSGGVTAYSSVDWDAVVNPPFKVTLPANGKAVIIDNEVLENMTVEELQKFGYLLAILKINDYRFPPKTVQIMGEKLLPRFFKEGKP